MAPRGHAPTARARQKTCRHCNPPTRQQRQGRWSRRDTNALPTPWRQDAMGSVNVSSKIGTAARPPRARPTLWLRITRRYLYLIAWPVAATTAFSAARRLTDRILAHIERRL